ncbi:MAG: hypothetical protein WAQ28_02795 [Bacteroidia bacterium]|jgi:hypothetical protein
MKKHIFLLSLGSLLSAGAFSQISKGTKFLGGNLSAGLERSDNFYDAPGLSESTYINRSFGITPGFGYFISDKMAIGLSAGYSYSYNGSSYKPSGSSSYTQINSTRGNWVSANPYVRYYLTLGEKAALFSQLNASYSHGFMNKDFVYDDGMNEQIEKNKISSLRLGISLVPGFSYFLSDKFALETTIGNVAYEWTKNTGVPIQTVNAANTYITTHSRLGLNFSTSTINIGFRYFIPSKT